ncbi:MAG: acyl-CoA dehydrogenase family protein [Rhodobacteraceae bacterium]|nr:acyl-CoA dehydrogenase family protein [Paracoccaceae bacterium]
MEYRSAVDEIRFHLRHGGGFARVGRTERFAGATEDVVEAVLQGAARLCDGVLAPLNRVGDLHPARLENGTVRTPPGFAEGFRAIAGGGWIGLSADPAHGGQGLPLTVETAVNEMMAGACMALQLNPLLTQGQIAALEHHAEPRIRSLYLPKLVSGEWSGTMNLTEPQAGSDLGALRTRAERAADGAYRITGQKIFITWGDSDFMANTCHLVLARLPGAPAGTRGISLFLVPKFIPDAAGRPGRPNSLRVAGLEHKMGIHGAPTCVMDYDAATGWLIGAENGGMAAMFTMMNAARLAVGVQGVGIAEAALQKAEAYAAGRIQQGPILRHPDVRRMLACARAELFAARAIALDCAAALDLARAEGPDVHAAKAAFLTPVAKSFGTEVGLRVCETAMQVFGGAGYVEQTGIAQHYRDVRITAIYEGTNGIQAMDLVGRKLADGGEAAFRLIEEVEAEAEAARSALPDMAGPVWAAAESLREATEELLSRTAAERSAGAHPFLMAFARVLGAGSHLRAARADAARAPMARVYVGRLLPLHAAHLAEVRAGPDDLEAVRIGPEAP